MGRLIVIAGWLAVVIAAVWTLYGTVETASDPSVAAYWPLAAFEGGIYVLLGGAIIVAGRFISRREAHQADLTVQDVDKSRTILVGMFWGQAVIASIAALLLGLWMGSFGLDSPDAEIAGYVSTAVVSVVPALFLLGALPFWVGLRLKQGKGGISAVLYSIALLAAFPVGTALGGVQLFLLHRLRKSPPAV